MPSNADDFERERQGAAFTGSAAPRERTHAHAGEPSATGEFTAVFAALGSSGAPSAVPETAPGDDEFLKFFQAAAHEAEKDVQAAPDVQQPVSTTKLEPQSSGHIKFPQQGAPQERNADEATLVFEALPQSVSRRQDTAPSPAPPQTALRTDPRGAIADSPTVFAEPESIEQTRIFASGAPPNAPAVPRTAPMTPSSTPSERTSEFTQVFKPIAPPPAPLAPAQRAPEPPVTTGGEFTQFFSAISAREQARKPTLQAAPPSAAAPLREVAISSPMQGTSPAAPGFERTPTSGQQSAEDNGGFTQLFQGGAPATQPNVMAPSMTVAPGLQPVVEPHARAKGEPSFTQVFQQIQPPPPASQPSSVPVVGVTPPASSLPSDQGRGAFHDAASSSAFGAPPQSRGSFTDVFAAQPGGTPTPPRMSAVPATPPTAGDGFTALFQSPAQVPHRAATSSGAPDSFAAPSAFVGTAPLATGWPGSSATPQEQTPASGGGDFTRLMHSLNTPAQDQSSPAPGSFGAGGSFFAAPVVSGGGGESEYTRVLRGSAQRDAVAPAAPNAVSAASGASPGVAMDAPKKPAESKVAEPKKSKTMVILLVVMNVLLLLALIVIGIVVLKRH